MKKIQVLSGALLLAVVAGFLFVACQKDQTAVTSQNASASDRSTIKATVNDIQGLISQDHASAMAAAYAAQNPGKSQYVVFEVKNLAGFLNSIAGKDGTKIYVNFGVYDKNTDPSGGANAGKLTVFFTGTPFSSSTQSSGTVQNNGGTPPSDALNNGSIYP